MQRIFPIEEFLASFPEFSDETVYKRPYVQSAGQRAMMHIGNALSGFPLQEPQRTYALFLLSAHIAALTKQGLENASGGGDTTGGLAGMAFKATVGSVSVETTKPNSFTSDDFSFWLSQTQYGRELLALFDAHSENGIFLNTSEDSVRDLV